jgi:hypothetical protein
MDWLEPLRQDTERIRQETIKIREETERLRESNRKLRELNQNSKKLLEIVEKTTMTEKTFDPNPTTECVAKEPTESQIRKRMELTQESYYTARENLREEAYKTTHTKSPGQSWGDYWKSY